MDFKKEMVKLKLSIPRGIDNQRAQTYIDLMTGQTICIVAAGFFKRKEAGDTVLMDELSG
jgi:hypothetical protein